MQEPGQQAPVPGPLLVGVQAAPGDGRRRLHAGSLFPVHDTHGWAARSARCVRGSLAAQSAHDAAEGAMRVTGGVTSRSLLLTHSAYMPPFPLRLKISKRM